MALYLGSEKVQINLNGIIYHLNLYTTTLILNGISLISSDDYILKDSNGLYLTVLDANPTSAKLGNAIIGTMKLGG